MGGILADLKFALRTLRRSPLFTLIAVLSLALGIGANTAIFSLMDQLLLRLLPVKDPDSLVMLSQRGTNMGGNDGERANSYPIYQDYQQRAEAFRRCSARKCPRESRSRSTIRPNWSQRKWCRATTLARWE